MPRARALPWSCLLLATLAAASSDQPAFPAPKPGDRILVVSPHPDDESLCCGGYLSSARRAGAEVHIVWITSGGAFRFNAMVVEKKIRPKQADMQSLARRRIGEAKAAAEVLGVEPAHRYFLGFPDRGITALLTANYDSPYRSKYTGADRVPWDEAVDPGSPYDGANLEKTFASIVDRIDPTLVLAPSLSDTHPDHSGSGMLAMRVLGARGESNRLRYWIVHGGRGWPTPRGLRPDLPQTVSPRGKGMPWSAFPLDALSQDTKVLALRRHETQMKVMGSVMMSHVRSTELYSVVPIAGWPGQAECVEDAGCVANEAIAEEAPL